MSEPGMSEAFVPDEQFAELCRARGVTVEEGMRQAVKYWSPSRRVSVRLSVEDRKRLEAACTERGMTPQQALTQAILDWMSKDTRRDFLTEVIFTAGAQSLAALQDEAARQKKDPRVLVCSEALRMLGIEATATGGSTATGGVPLSVASEAFDDEQKGGWCRGRR